MVILKFALIGAACGALIIGAWFYLAYRFGEGGGFLGSKDMAWDWGLAGACAGAIGGFILGLLTGLITMLVRWMRAG